MYSAAVAVSSAASTICERLSTVAVMSLTVPCVAGAAAGHALPSVCEPAGATLCPMWNPDVYLAFADHRGRPFFDLVNRVRAENPRRVADLGCGPGNLT